MNFKNVVDIFGKATQKTINISNEYIPNDLKLYSKHNEQHEFDSKIWPKINLKFEK